MFDINKIKALLVGDGEAETNINQFMQKKQMVMGVIAVVVLVILVLLFHSLSSNKSTKKVVNHTHKRAVADGVITSDFTEKNQLSALEQQQLEIKRIQHKLDTDKNNQAREKVDEKAARKKLLLTINQIIDSREKAHAAVTPKSMPVSNVFAKPDDGVRPTYTLARPIPEPINTVHFTYSDTVQFQPAYKTYKKRNWKASINGKTDKTYVPAGTFARGVLLEGADANASVNGQSDTVGILVRILDQGVLPNGHHSHLKGCFVLASIYGDISSERGEARLNRLSCTRKDGSILERKVQGYLSFAGKEGIKGHPVMRNGKILAMAGLSGMFSGFGTAMQQSSQTQSVSPLGITSTVSPSKVWASGLYGGAGSAMSQMAKYYIKRADQYHPVIEIGSGTVATIIFQSGFSLISPIDDQRSSHSLDHAQVTESKSSSNEEIRNILKAANKIPDSKSNAPFSDVGQGGIA